MLLAICSPKGGSGTSVVAAASAVLLARRASATLADLDGDQAALLGLASDPEAGLVDWLAAGPAAPTEALDRLAIEVGPDLRLLPRGRGERALGPVAAAEAGAALATALRDQSVVADAGGATTPAARALVEVADAVVVVLRPCYLALRRATHSPLLARAAGVIVVEEPQRSLRSRDVSEVLDVPTVGRIPWRASIANVVDAGTLIRRPPDALLRPVEAALARLGVVSARGRAA